MSPCLNLNPSRISASRSVTLFWVLNRLVKTPESRSGMNIAESMAKPRELWIFTCIHSFSEFSIYSKLASAPSIFSFRVSILQLIYSSSQWFASSVGSYLENLCSVLCHLSKDGAFGVSSAMPLIKVENWFSGERGQCLLLGFRHQAS